MHKIFLKYCFKFIIDLIVYKKSIFFINPFHKTLSIKNILSTNTLFPERTIEYSKIVLKCLMGI